MITEKMPEHGPACGRCRWWGKMNGLIGKCRRMPPAAHFEEGHYWPITGRSDWCGEFKVKAEGAG